MVHTDEKPFIHRFWNAAGYGTAVGLGLGFCIDMFNDIKALPRDVHKQNLIYKASAKDICKMGLIFGFGATSFVVVQALTSIIRRDDQVYGYVNNAVGGCAAGASYAFITKGKPEVACTLCGAGAIVAAWAHAAGYQLTQQSGPGKMEQYRLQIERYNATELPKEKKKREALENLENC